MRTSPIFLRDAAGSFVRLTTWLAVTALVLVALMWPQMAHAQVASPRCPTPFTLSVAHSGSGTVNANACHEGFGIGFLISGPTNGTVSIDTLASTVTYTHNGNSATSDTFRFDDGSGFFVQVNVTIGPASSITIAPVSLPAMTAGTPFSQALAASGGSSPYNYAVTAGTLPAGLSLSTGGVISGTPTQRGSFSFSVTATDSTAATGTKSYTPTVAGGTLSITPNPPPNAVISVPYSTTFTPSGGVAPMTLMWEPNPSFPLPPGLALSGNTLSGTPTATGNYTFGIRVTDSSTGPGSWFQVVTVTMTVSPPPTITVNPATVPGATVGAAYSQTLSGSGGTAPYSFAITAGALPAGVTLGIGGALSGTPTAAGTFNFTARATDNNGFSGTRAYTLLSGSPSLGMAPAAGALPAGSVGSPYSQSFTASSGTAPYNFAVTAGALPPGVTLAANGTMSGTPTASGTFNFTVTATDSSTGTGAPFSIGRSYSVTIAAPTITVSPTTLPAATVGAAYSQGITASGGTAPYSFAITAGALPAGLTMALDGTLSGTPTAGGSFNFTVTATDPFSSSGSRAYSLLVSAPAVSVAPTTLPNATVASAYSQSLTASGGTAPYAFSVTAGSLPAGLTLTSGGALSGSPTSGGTFNFTITAQDSSTGTGPYTGSRAYSLTVAAPAVVLAPVSLPDGTIGSAYSQAITASGGTAPYSFSVTAGALPPGVALGSGGALSGTPTATGSFSFTVTALDSSTGTGPYAGSQAYTLTIADMAPVANAVSATVAFNSAGNPITLNITGGTPSSVAVATAATNGTAIASGTSITYTPTPGFAGPDSFTYTATNGAGTSAPATVTITVSTPTVSVTPAGPLGGIVGNAFSQTFTFSGGTAPYGTFSVSGLPAGLAVTGTAADSVTVSGTPTQSGSFTLVVSGTDSSTGSGPFTATQNVGLDVLPPALSLPPSGGPIPANVGAPFSQSFVATGGTAPFSYAITAGTLPGGLSFNAATGLLSGTPVGAGTFTFTLTATDSSTGAGAPFSISRSYSINVAAAIAISPATLPDGIASNPYSQTITASGVVAPFTFSVVAGALPAGLTLSPAGDLSGTPTVAGTFNFTVRVRDAGATTAEQAYALVIAAPTITIAPATLPDGVGGTAYTRTFTASGGAGPYTWSLASGTLPPGVTLSSAGILSGTPTTAGTFNFTLVASDANGFTGSQAYALVIAAPTITLAPASLPGTVAGIAYSQTITASGGTGPYAYSLLAGSLPVGMSFSSAGVLSGTPTVDGTYNFTVRGADSFGFTGDQAYSLVVIAPTVVLSPTTLPGGTAGGAYSQAITASGGTGPYSFSLLSGALPIGMSFSSAGVLSGTPTVAGTTVFTVRGTDANGYSGDQAYTLAIVQPTIVLAPATLPDGAVGTAYNQTITASGGNGAYVFGSSGALPPGLTLSSTGLLSGTPTAAGSYTFTVRATDAFTFIGEQTYTVNIAVPTIVLAPATLPDGVGGSAYSQTITASGGTGPYAFFAVPSALPPGLSLDVGGVLSGTPTAAGSYTFTVQAADVFGVTGNQAYTLVITAPAIVVTPATLPDAAGGVAYSQTLAATGGTAPYTFNLFSGALPAGLTLDSSGALSGTPAASGTFNFTVRAADALGFAGTRAYTLVVTAPSITVTPATLADGVVGTAYSQTLSASGGVAPYGFAVTAGALPAGLTLGAGGVLAGTPSAAGSFAFDVTATDTLGFTGTASFVVVIGDAPPVAVDDSASTDAGTGVSIAVTANDTGVIDAVSVASAPSNGTAIASGTSITYTPAAGFFGNDSFTYIATGPGGASNAATVTVEVRARPVPVGVAQTVTTLAGQAVSFDAAAGATGSPFTGVTLLAPPVEGVVTVSGTTITYTPAVTASGAVAIGYTLDNAFGPSAPITSTVNVNPLPMAASHAATTVVGVAVQVELTQGATGGPFTAADVVSVSPAGAGTTQVTTGGPAGTPTYTLTFTPSAGFVGTAVVTYTLDNAFATSAPADVTIEVTQRPDPTQDPEVTGLLGAQSTAARRFARGQIDNFQSRMERLHDGGGQGFANGLTVAITSRCHDGRVQRPGEACADEPLALPGANAAAPGAEAPAASRSNAPFGVWTAGGMAFGDFDLRGSGNGFEFETSAISLGMDYRLSPGFVLGAGLGYGRDVTDVGENGTRSEATARSLAVYGSHQLSQAWFVDMLLGYQDLSFDARRYVTATGGMVEGNRDGDQWFTSLVSTYERREEAYTLAPYLRVDVARATLDAFTEQGDPVYSLHYGQQDVDTTTGNLGMRLELHNDTGWGMFSPMFRVEYQYDFQDPGVATLSYADLLGGPFYRTRVQDLDTSRLLLGLGAILQTESEWLLKAEFRGLLGSGQDEHSIMLHVEKEF